MFLGEWHEPVRSQAFTLSVLRLMMLESLCPHLVMKKLLVVGMRINLSSQILSEAIKDSHRKLPINHGWNTQQFALARVKKESLSY